MNTTTPTRAGRLDTRAPGARHLSRMVGVALLAAVWPLGLTARQSDSGASFGDPGWSGNGHLALTHNTGSTDFFSLAVDHDLTYQSSTTQLQLHTAFSYSRSAFTPTGPPDPEEQTTRFETYSVHAVARRSVASIAHGVVRAGWDRDPSSGLGHRLRALGGVGVRTAPGPNNLEVEAVGGYMFEAEIDDDTMDFPAVGVVVGLSRQVGETGSWSINADVVENVNNTDDVLVTARTRLNARLSSHLGLAIGYAVVWDNRPSDSFFDPTGDGSVTSTPQKTRTSLSASLTVQW